MDPAAPHTLYRVSRARRSLDLLVQTGFALAGTAMVLYTGVKVLPLLKEAPAFLARGWVAWLGAAPAALILVPFLLFFLSWCLRAIFSSWADAASTATVTLEGSVTLAASDRYATMSGRAFVSGTATRLSVDGHMFTSLPERTIKRIRVGDRVRILHTPRVNYVTEVVRLEGAR
jgi:hypothetical protein